MAIKHLEDLWKRGKGFLGVRYALLGGAMTWVSERNLVSAISNAGGFGVIASGAMSPDLLRTEIKATQALTQNPFGVNLITLHPQLLDLIDVCIEEKVTHVVLAGGLPSAQAITHLKASGVKVICFAPALIIAKKLMKLGVDALIIEGMEAGGHIGPVSTSVLVQEILPHVKEIPVFVAGGIGRGEAIVSYLEMGAAGCQLGTHFVCATESVAHPEFKKAFIRAQARDAIISPQLDSRFPVIPVRALTNQATKDFLAYQRELINQVDQGTLDLKEAQLKIEHFWAGALRRAVIEGDVENGSMMAGQSVGMVTCEQPTQNIIDELISQAEAALKSRTNQKASSIC
ncbi:nitronate monooxygenase [Kamptonema cortianum]|nr:nitronate monooxygenase [Kamptonema cortianum]